MKSTDPARQLFMSDKDSSLFEGQRDRLTWRNSFDEIVAVTVSIEDRYAVTFNVLAGSSAILVGFSDTMKISVKPFDPSLSDFDRSWAKMD